MRKKAREGMDDEKYFGTVVLEKVTKLLVRNAKNKITDVINDPIQTGINIKNDAFPFAW